MIEVDKYKGHNISKVTDSHCGTSTLEEMKANRNLVQDAALILEAYKRLHELTDKWV